MKKRQPFTLRDILIIVAVFATLAALLYPALTNFGGTPYPNKYRAQCQSNLKRIGIAFLQYAKDYDDKFPPLALEWKSEQERLTPYVLTYEIFQCPATRDNATNSTDYFYNARLAGADKMKIANADAPVDFVIISGDGADDEASSISLAQLPAAWRKDENSPAFRHLDGANYLFIDGHVKWFKPEKITLDKPSAGHPTFRVK